MGHFRFCPPFWSGGDPPGGKGYVASLHTCEPLRILAPALKRWGTPRSQGLCSHLAHLGATNDYLPRSEALGTPPGSRGSVATWPTWEPLMILSPALKRWGPPGGRGYVASQPTCGPLLILSPALKRWGPPRRQGLCSHLAHLCATFDSLPYSEAVGTPQAAGVM